MGGCRGLARRESWNWSLVVTAKSEKGNALFSPPMSRLGAPSSSAAAFFPSARYTSLVGVHASLTVFAALFLPRTALSDVLPAPLLHLLPTPDSEPSTGQGQFVDALAAAPAATLAWLVVGIALLQVWWAGWLRAWGAEYQRERLGVGAAAAQDKDEARLARTGSAGLVAPESVRRATEAGACTLVGAGALFGVLVVAGAPLDRYEYFGGAGHSDAHAYIHRIAATSGTPRSSPRSSRSSRSTHPPTSSAPLSRYPAHPHTRRFPRASRGPASSRSARPPRPRSARCSCLH
jgi:hypothetical protein